MQAIEEKTNETRLILSSDIHVLKSIKNHYNTLWDSEDFPTRLKQESKAGFQRFHSRLDATVESLQMQLTRVECMLRLLGDRISLVYALTAAGNSSADFRQLNDMFTYRNIQASQNSAKEMEDLKAITYKIALRTETETVAMKLITLVTLLFCQQLSFR